MKVRQEMEDSDTGKLVHDEVDATVVVSAKRPPYDGFPGITDDLERVGVNFDDPPGDEVHSWVFPDSIIRR